MKLMINGKEFRLNTDNPNGTLYLEVCTRTTSRCGSRASWTEATIHDLPITLNAVQIEQDAPRR